MENDRTEAAAFWRRASRIAQALALTAAGALYFLAGREYALGLLLGAIVSMVRFRLRYRAMLQSPTAGGLVRLRLITYAMSGAALAVAFLWPAVFNPWGAIPGLLVMNVSVIAAELLDRSKISCIETSAGG